MYQTQKIDTLVEKLNLENKDKTHTHTYTQNCDLHPDKY